MDQTHPFELYRTAPLPKSNTTLVSLSLTALKWVILGPVMGCSTYAWIPGDRNRRESFGDNMSKGTCKSMGAHKLQAASRCLSWMPRLLNFSSAAN